MTDAKTTKALTMVNAETTKDFADRIERMLAEYEEKMLLEIIRKYDFYVGSMETKHMLIEALPEGAVRDEASIIYSPYFINDPGKIYAIKKFDLTEFISECRAESEKK